VIVRSVPSQSRTIFLTFDDGPDQDSTPVVLDVLARKGVPATFFLIAEKSRGQTLLVSRMKDEGHAFGNHSLDHRYRNFFRGHLRVREWIEESQRQLFAQGVKDSVGFRPPAGILTPPLVRAASELNEPLVLWSERFYDAVFPWTLSRALNSAARIRGGAIVLLHDRQSASKAVGFSSILAGYIDGLRARGFEFSALTRELCQGETPNVSSRN
jgi:peptidoglycan/xylan/chitin deacetylase (PgdA/CDA1 family)